MVLAKSESFDATLVTPGKAVPRGIVVAPDPRMRQAQAETMMRYHLALMDQREWIEVGAKLLASCDNPDFAKEALYSKPNGTEPNIEGLSIRFAEHAIGIIRNLSVDMSPEMEDDRSLHYRMVLTDLESNTPTSETFRVEKTIERRYLREGQVAVSKRINDEGIEVFLVVANEDQLNAKIRGVAARVKRALVLAVIPAEIRRDCVEKCRDVIKDQHAKDPAAAVKAMVSSFLSLGVEVSDLKEYLGKPPQSATEKEVIDLRGLFTLIRDGEQTWADVVDAKRERVAATSAKAKFIEDKKKEKEKRKASAAPAAPRAEGAPKPRRGRGAAATETAAATEQTTEPTPPPPPPPAATRARASRRGDDEDEAAPGSSTDDNSATT